MEREQELAITDDVCIHGRVLGPGDVCRECVLETYRVSATITHAGDRTVVLRFAGPRGALACDRWWRERGQDDLTLWCLENGHPDEVDLREP